MAHTIKSPLVLVHSDIKTRIPSVCQVMDQARPRPVVRQSDNHSNLSPFAAYKVYCTFPFPKYGSSSQKGLVNSLLTLIRQFE